MRFTVWNHKPKRPGEAHRPLAREAEEFEAVLVHWTEEMECRSILLHVAEDGTVTVEHSTYEHIEGAPDVEHVTRVTLPGWEES